MASATVRSSNERDLVAQAVQTGSRDVNALTDMIFYARHPALMGQRINRRRRGLVQEWLTIRDRIVRPVVAAVIRASGPAARVAPRRTTGWLRAAWREFECADHRMVPIRILGTRTPVNPLTRQAFAALEQALRSTGYRPRSVWNYNCRDIKGQPGRRSLHAYGLALDVDPGCNPHRAGAAGPARFSPARSQLERCQDVRAGWADTAFTPEQVAATEAIQTIDGLQVFTWGGRWTPSPDSMHFQINVSPQELRRGVVPR